MAHDFKQKEPSKNERMIYELAMNQNSMEKALWSTSTVVMALAMLSNAKPEEIAELMVNGDEKLKEYSGKINEVIKRLEEAKNPKGEAHHYDHDHDHAGHDHSH